MKGYYDDDGNWVEIYEPNHEEIVAMFRANLDATLTANPDDDQLLLIEDFSKVLEQTRYWYLHNHDQVLKWRSDKKAKELGKGVFET